MYAGTQGPWEVGVPALGPALVFESPLRSQIQCCARGQWVGVLDTDALTAGSAVGVVAPKVSRVCGLHRTGRPQGRRLSGSLGQPGARVTAATFVQCRTVKIAILGDEGVPVQVDGEAWVQPPGCIRIIHKNRAQMLTRDRVRLPGRPGPSVRPCGWNTLF